jgi:hypothetical protein
MMKTALGFALAVIISMGAAKASDQDSETNQQRSKPVKTEDGHHGFFHPFQHFWTRTVGGSMSHGLKSFAGHVQHGIGGGGKD